MMNGQDGYISKLSGLELAKYVLLRLVDNHDSVEKVAKDFDNDVRFILGEIDLLKVIGWIEQDLTSGIYQITENGKMGKWMQKLQK
jgi:hypothetical protein